MPTSSDSIPAVALEQKGKRRATESDEVAAVKSTKTRDLQSAQHASIDHDGEDMGEFEDPWEDEYDSSEEGSVHMDALSEDGVDQGMHLYHANLVSF